jgi:hypothetical protein
MIRRPLFAGGPACSFEVPVTQGNRAHAMKARSQKRRLAALITIS